MDATTGLGGSQLGGVCRRVIPRPPPADMDEDGLPLMGSGIDLTKVCESLELKFGGLVWRPGRRMGKGRSILKETPISPGPALTAGLGKESPTVHFKKGGPPELRGSCASPSVRFSYCHEPAPKGDPLETWAGATSNATFIRPPSFWCACVCCLYRLKFTFVNPEPVYQS